VSPQSSATNPGLKDAMIAGGVEFATFTAFFAAL
jgi:hypothetical protein